MSWIPDPKDIAELEREVERLENRTNLDREHKLDEKYGQKVVPLHEHTKNWKRRDSHIERAIREVLLPKPRGK